jgi:predicted  nucleic acid-binding Zn-ribbon protein
MRALTYIRADWLEYEVWSKVKELLNDSGKLVECINKSLVELEERRKKIGAESMAVESKLKAVKAREERLGMAFADGAVNESAYRSKLKRLAVVLVFLATPFGHASGNAF